MQKKKIITAEKICADIILKNIAQPKFLLQSLSIGADSGTLEILGGIAKKIIEIETANTLMDLNHSPLFISPQKSRSPPPSQFTPSQSPYYTKISYRRLRSLERCEKIAKSVEISKKAGKFINNEETTRLYSTALAHCPGLSLYGAEILIASSIKAFSSKIGLALTNMEISKAFTPSQSTMSLMILETAASIVQKLQQDIENADSPIYLACDKGNKKGISHFVKYFAFWFDNKVQLHLLDLDAAGGSNNEAADAIDFSMKKIDPLPPKIRLKVQGGMTDAGGGGVGEGLKRELITKNRANDTYISGTCAIHALSVALSVPIIKLMGDGGLGKSNLLQLLHSAYNLQTGGGGTFEVSEFSLTWMTLFGEKFNKMLAPILTRWYLVGKGCQHMSKHWDKWRVIAHKICDYYGADTAPNKCASALIAQMSEPFLKAQLEFVNEFHAQWWNGHYVWLTEQDTLTLLPGFRAHHMSAFSYILVDSLKIQSSFWSQTFTSYNEVKVSVTKELEKELLIKMEKEFFILSMGAVEKHFVQWKSKQTLPFALAGEPIIATALAKWMCNQPPSDGSFSSIIYRRNIDVERVLHFLTTETTPADFVSLTDTFPAIQEIADGKKLWEEDISVEMKKFKEHVQKNYLPFPVHTQFVESGVKVAALVSETGKEERMRSAVAQIRSATVRPFNDKAKLQQSHKTIDKKKPSTKRKYSHKYYPNRSRETDT